MLLKLHEVACFNLQPIQPIQPAHSEDTLDGRAAVFHGLHGRNVLNGFPQALTKDLGIHQHLPDDWAAGGNRLPKGCEAEKDSNPL